MPTTRLADLFQKYFDKTATPDERAEFMRLTASDENAMELRSLMEQAWTKSDQPDPLSASGDQEHPFFDAKQSQSMLRNVLEQAKSQDQTPATAQPTPHQPAVANLHPVPTTAVQSAPIRELRRSFVPRSSSFGTFAALGSSWIRATAAAAVLILLITGITLWQQHANKSASTAVAQLKPATPPPAVIPGSNKATLILNDGSTVALDSLRTGTLATQGNTRIVQLTNGRLSYNTTTMATTATLYNTVRTPRGGQYQVTLPDGSKVWLNAATSLRFPTAFTGRDRTVELTGEAYFEIARNKDQPFHVKAGEMTVNVLGTHFNIMAYENEGSVNTSLLQGSVRVEQASETSQTHQTRLLQPGQESRLNIATGQLLVAAADTDQAVAWKNGLFQFDGATLETVMHQVERWYDVEVRYEGEVNMHFSGQIPRSASLPQVLHMLDGAGKTRFTLEGRTVVVKPY
jgi:transmembrane sensor